MDKCKIRQAIEFLSTIGFLPLIATLPFFFGKPQLFSLYIAAFFYLLDYFVNRRWSEWSGKNVNLSYLLFIALFFFVLFRALFDNYFSSQLSATIDRYLPFLIFGIIGVIGYVKKIRLEYVAWVMQIVSVIIILRVLYELHKLGIPFIGVEEWLKEYNHYMHHTINSHMVVNMYLNFLLIVSIYVMLHSNISKGLRVITFLGIFPAVWLLLISNGRAGIIGFILSIFVLFTYYLIRKSKWHIFLFIAMYGLIVLGVIGSKDKFYDATMSNNPRLHIWKVCVDMIKERPVWGYGICSARKEFVERGLSSEDFYNNYAWEILSEAEVYKKKPDFYRMHPHNAFLEVWMQMGLFGVLLLLATLYSLTQLKLKGKQVYLNLCLLNFLIQMLFESFGSHLQPLFLCLMVILFHYSPDEERKKLFGKGGVFFAK